MGVDGDLDEKVRDPFHRDGRLAGIGEGLGVIDTLAVEKQQHAGADTNKFGVCVAQIHRDGGAALLPHKKGLRRVDKEEVI